MTINNNIGVIGFGFSNNYGAILTNYALISYLKSIGKNPIMIDKPRDLVNYAFSDITYTEKLEARRFINKYLSGNISRVYKNKYDLRKINEICSCFIVGSDQVWSNTLYKPAQYFTFLEFVKDENKKISYSSSFGYNDWACSDLYTDYERYMMKYWLRKFDYVSVREDSGVNVCKEQFDIKAVHVLDSVFIAPKETYDDLIENATVKIDKNYFLAYLLEPDEKLKGVVDYCQNITKTDYYTVSDPDRADIVRECSLKNVISASVEDWLYLFKHSNMVVTNSFHGVCFSILFKKQFVYVIDDYRKDWTTRVVSLLKLLDIHNRVVSSIDEIDALNCLSEKINYDKVYEKLDQLICFSRNWLNNAINSDFPGKCSCDIESALLQDKIDFINSEIGLIKFESYNLNNQINNLERKIFLLANKKTILLKYFKYKLCAKLSFGSLKEKYRTKKLHYKDLIKEIRKPL